LPHGEPPQYTTQKHLYEKKSIAKIAKKRKIRGIKPQFADGFGFYGGIMSGLRYFCRVSRDSIATDGTIIMTKEI